MDVKTESISPKFLLMGTLLFIVLCSCNLPTTILAAAPTLDSTQIHLTSEVLLSQTTSPEKADLTPSPTPDNQNTLPLTAATDVLSINAPESKIPCDLAKAGNPLDITIPDNTRVETGSTFNKTWLITNAGSCVWTEEYQAVWFSGETFGKTQSIYLNKSVAPGESIEITLYDLVAPKTPGTYQSNWKLRNPDGNLFGLGPNGDAPFWIKIVAALPPTPTIFGTQTPTPIPSIYIDGPGRLSPGQGIDLDSLQVDFEGKNKDVIYNVLPVAKHILYPQGKVRIGFFDTKEPSYQDCQLAVMRADPIYLDNYSEGSYFCYQTSLSLPGYLKLVSINPEGSWLKIEIVTWSVP